MHDLKNKIKYQGILALLHVGGSTSHLHSWRGRGRFLLVYYNSLHLWLRPQPGPGCFLIWSS